jgi:hypothetical protein
MKASSAEDRFVQRLKSASNSGHPLDLAAAIEAMLAFYAEERAGGCDLAAIGDRLVYRWGVDDEGGGAVFEVSITRELFGGGESEGVRWEFSLTFWYDPSVTPSELSGGSRWCDAPGQLAEFRRLVTGSPAYRAVRRLRPSSVFMRYGQA